jgi:hypothetical protein
MLLGILSFLTGLSGPIQYITGKLADLGIAKANAATDKEKNELDAAIQEAHDRKAELVAEVANRFASTLNASMRFLLALGPTLYVTKIFLWDKVIGSWPTFRTDSVTTEQWAVVAAVLAFYLGYDVIAQWRK